MGLALKIRSRNEKMNDTKHTTADMSTFLPHILNILSKINSKLVGK